MKKSKSLLVAAIIGVVFFGLWVWALIVEFKIEGSYLPIQEIFHNLVFGYPGQSSLTFFMAKYFLLLPVILISGIVFNFIGWTKSKRKNVLVSGILYTLSLNLPSAILCLVEYANMKKPINNKSMLISVFLGLLVALLVLGFAILLGSPEDVGGAMGVFIFFLAVPLAAAMVNFFAWKTRKKALALVAAITYTVGILSIVSAVICYINFARWKTEKPINNKSMLISVILGLLVALPSLVFAIFIGAPDDSSRGIFIFFFAVPLAAAIVNFFAWKTRKKALALVAAITYTVGILSIASAVICYINFARWRKIS